jgi:hypothetical protein
MNRIQNRLSLAAMALAAASMLSCSGDLTNNAAPVELIVTNTQTLTRLDIDPNTTDSECAGTIGTINMQVLPKGAATGDLIQVRTSRYRISYRRTDGGTQVPRGFVRTLDTLIASGSSATATFTVFEADAFSQAPFAALRPQNGGRDAETGRPVVQMEVILEVWGETLGGDNVYDATSFPLELCFACGGCS